MEVRLSEQKSKHSKIDHSHREANGEETERQEVQSKEYGKYSHWTMNWGPGNL